MYRFGDCDTFYSGPSGRWQFVHYSTKAGVRKQAPQLIMTSAAVDEDVLDSDVVAFVWVIRVRSDLSTNYLWTQFDDFHTALVKSQPQFIYNILLQSLDKQFRCWFKARQSRRIFRNFYARRRVQAAGVARCPSISTYVIQIPCRDKCAPNEGVKRYRSAFKRRKNGISETVTNTTQDCFVLFLVAMKSKKVCSLRSSAKQVCLRIKRYVTEGVRLT